MCLRLSARARVDRPRHVSQQQRHGDVVKNPVGGKHQQRHRCPPCLSENPIGGKCVRKYHVHGVRCKSRHAGLGPPARVRGKQRGGVAGRCGVEQYETRCTMNQWRSLSVMVVSKGHGVCRLVKIVNVFAERNQKVKRERSDHNASVCHAPPRLTLAWAV